MAKQSQARALSKSVVKFSIAEWREELCAAALQFDGAAVRLLKLALSARGKVDNDVAKEAFQQAFGGAFAASRGVTFEEAVKSKTVQNRVSDALAVFKAEKLPGFMPDQLQAAAKACREANPKAKRAPRAGGKSEKDPITVALEMTHNGLEQLRHAVGDDAEALAAIAGLTDLLASLEDALTGEATGDSDAIEGEVVAA